MKSWNRWCNNASLSDGVELVRPGDIDHGAYRRARIRCVRRHPAKQSP
ncbi:hypothetical protein MYA98_23270 [Salmonella sp. WGH-01]|nr:hypothetical protein MYA98_23270 [Salmonella sp. WGH-01]